MTLYFTEPVEKYNQGFDGIEVIEYIIRRQIDSLAVAVYIVEERYNVLI